MAPKQKQPRRIFLPMIVVGPVDLARLLRELENIDEALLQLKLRSGGEATKMPKTSQSMDKTVEINKLNLLQDEDRKDLMELLKAAKERAPRLHISFSADPSPEFTESLITWLRKEIHPFLLLSIGLQPDIGAGCTVRTINHRLDLSLRQDFIKKRALLMQELTKALQAQPAKQAPQPVAQPVQGVKP